MLPPLADVVLDPRHHGLVDLLLRPDIELVARGYLHELVERKEEKLLVVDHLLEMMLGEGVRLLEEVATGVRVGEGPDAEAVRRVELPLQELAADVLDLLQLQETGGRQEGLHVGLLHHDVRVVTEVDERLHGGLLHIADRDFGLARLRHLASEHGTKVRRTRRQDDSEIGAMVSMVPWFWG